MFNVTDTDPTVSTNPGDANGDGKVDINDLTIVLTNYDKSTGMTWATGDFNGDGKVDINDLSIVLTNYDKTVRRGPRRRARALRPCPAGHGCHWAARLLLAEAAGRVGIRLKRAKSSGSIDPLVSAMIVTRGIGLTCAGSTGAAGRLPPVRLPMGETSPGSPNLRAAE